MSSRVLAVACGLACTSVLPAQQTPAPSPGYTQMIVGMGYWTQNPSIVLGFEHKRSSSPIAWRVMLEYWDDFQFNRYDSWSHVHIREVSGAQLLGVRIFRARHRFQPYLLGGLGLYYDKGLAAGMTPAIGPDTDPPQPYRDEWRRFHPSVIWGGGMSVRVSGLTLFSELKLPLPSTGGRGFRLGPQMPLVFGVRF